MEVSAMRALACEIRRFKRILKKELRLIELLDRLEVWLLRLENRLHMQSRWWLAAATLLGAAYGAVLYYVLN